MTTETPPAPPETNNKIEVESLAIGAHHCVNFDQARAHLEKTYGKSPPPDDLMRLWLASATPWDITRQFEEAVLNIAGSGIVPDDDGHYAQSLLNL